MFRILPWVRAIRFSGTGLALRPASLVTTSGAVASLPPGSGQVISLLESTISVLYPHATTILRWIHCRRFRLQVLVVTLSRESALTVRRRLQELMDVRLVALHAVYQLDLSKSAL